MGNSYLSKIETAQKLGPPRIVVYGKGGVGKTTLAADAPDAIFIPVEDGLGLLDVAHFPKPERFEEVLNMLTELTNEEHSYKTLVVDTVDALEQLVWKSICEEAGKINIEDFGYGRGYKKADQPWIDFFRRLDALRAAKRMTIVVLGHEQMLTNVDDPIIGPHTRYQTNLHERADKLMIRWADVVGFLDTRDVAGARGSGDGPKTRVAQGTGDRVIYLEDRGAFAAKNRYSLPTEIRIPKENPFAPFRAAIVKAMSESQPPTTPPPADEKKTEPKSTDNNKKKE